MRHLAKQSGPAIAGDFGLHVPKVIKGECVASGGQNLVIVAIGVFGERSMPL